MTVLHKSKFYQLFLILAQCNKLFYIALGKANIKSKVEFEKYGTSLYVSMGLSYLFMISLDLNSIAFLPKSF